MARIFKRANGILYLEYEVDGKTRQRSTRLPDTKDNRAFLKKEVIPSLDREILLGNISGKQTKTFKHYAKILLKDKEHVKTYNQLLSIVKILNLKFGDNKIDSINRGMIKDFIRERLEVNTPKTISNYLTPLRQTFDIAIDDEVIKNNPCDNITLPKHITLDVEPFTPNEVALILKSSHEWLKSFLAISFFTGMRTGEVLGLMHSDIDLDKRVISVKRSIGRGKISTPKTQSSIREVPILDGLVPYLPKPKALWLFPKQDGKPFSDFSGATRKEWHKVLEDCNIEYRKIYATRHTFIVSMLKNSDLSILEIAQIVGHSSTQMIIRNYGKFIKGEHLKIDRKIDLFAGISADTYSQGTL